MTRALLITNPAAARADARAVTAIRDTLRGGGWEVEVLATARPGDARRFAAAAPAQGFDVLVCYGGDGTAMQVAAGAVGTGLPLGLVPGGTGFDARLMALTGSAEKRRWRMGAYVARAFVALPQVKSVTHRVTVDGAARELRAAMVLVANCGELIPPFLRLRHDIAPDDGWLDVLALRADGALESVTAFLALVRGPANGSRQLWFGRGRDVRVEVLEGPSAPVQLDGEVTGETPFQVRLVPGALRVLVDPATASQRSDRRG